MGIILTIVAYILIAILSPFGILYAMIRSIFGNVNSDKYFFKVAVSLDQLGNVIMAPLFNHILIESEGKQFGDEDETISNIIGQNKSTNTLRFLGKFIAKILNKLERDHVEKAALNNS
jgi:8-oxo-dGTP diphosphatase